MKSGLKVLANKLSIKNNRQRHALQSDLGGGACDLYQPALMLEDDDGSLSLDQNAGAAPYDNDIDLSSSKEDGSSNNSYYSRTHRYTTTTTTTTAGELRSKKRKAQRRHSSSVPGERDSSHHSNANNNGRQNQTSNSNSNSNSKQPPPPQSGHTPSGIRERARRRSSATGVVLPTTTETTTSTTNPTHQQRPSVVRERRRSSMAATTNHTQTSEARAIQDKVEELKARAALMEQAKKQAPPREKNSSKEPPSRRIPPRRTKSTPEAGMMPMTEQRRGERGGGEGTTTTNTTTSTAAPPRRRMMPRKTKSNESHHRFYRGGTNTNTTNTTTTTNNNVTMHSTNTNAATAGGAVDAPIPPRRKRRSTSRETTIPADRVPQFKPSEQVANGNGNGSPPQPQQRSSLGTKIRHRRRGSVGCDGSDFGGIMIPIPEPSQAKQQAALAAAWRHKRGEMLKESEHYKQQKQQKALSSSLSQHMGNSGNNSNNKTTTTKHTTATSAAVQVEASVHSQRSSLTEEASFAEENINDNDNDNNDYQEEEKVQTPVGKTSSSSSTLKASCLAGIDDRTKRQQHHPHDLLLLSTQSDYSNSSGGSGRRGPQRRSSIACSTPTSRTRNTITGNNWMDAYNQDVNAPKAPSPTISASASASASAHSRSSSSNSSNQNSNSSRSRSRSEEERTSGATPAADTTVVPKTPAPSTKPTSTSPTSVIDDAFFGIKDFTFNSNSNTDKVPLAPPTGATPKKPSVPSVWQDNNQKAMAATDLLLLQDDDNHEDNDSNDDVETVAPVQPTTTKTWLAPPSGGGPMNSNGNTMMGGKQKLNVNPIDMVDTPSLWQEDEQGNLVFAAAAEDTASSKDTTARLLTTTPTTTSTAFQFSQTTFGATDDWTSFSNHGTSVIKDETKFALLTDGNDEGTDHEEGVDEDDGTDDPSEYEEDMTETEGVYEEEEQVVVVQEQEKIMLDHSEQQNATEQARDASEEEEEALEEEEEEEEKDGNDEGLPQEDYRSLGKLSYASSHSSQISPCPVPGDDYSIDADLTVTWSIYQDQEEDNNNNDDNNTHHSQERMNAIEEEEDSSTTDYGDEDDDLISALPMPRRTSYGPAPVEYDAKSLGYEDVDIDIEPPTWDGPTRKHLTELEQKLGYASHATGMTEASTIADSTMCDEEGKFRNTCDSVVLAKVSNKDHKKMPIGKTSLKEASWKQQRIPRHYADAGGIDESPKKSRPKQAQDDSSVGYNSVSDYSVATPQLTRDRVSRRASMGACTPFQRIFGVPGQDRPSSHSRRDSPPKNTPPRKNRTTVQDTEQKGLSVPFKGAPSSEDLGYGAVTETRYNLSKEIGYGEGCKRNDEFINKDYKSVVSKNDFVNKVVTRKVVPRRRHSMYSCVSIAEETDEDTSMHSKISNKAATPPLGTINVSTPRGRTARRGSVACDGDDRFGAHNYEDDNSIDE